MSADPGIAQRESKISWEPRRQVTLKAARRRSAIIKILRFAFLLLAAGIVAVVVLYITRNAMHEEAPPHTPPPEVDGEVRMINPRFSGRDNAGRPYVVIADTATRRRDEPDTTDLINPRLDTVPGANSSQVTSRRGVYDAAHKILDLFDDVQVSTPNGYKYKTEHARFYIDTDLIVGDVPVVGAGPMGTISADSYQIVSGGETVTFTGSVVTHIENSDDATGESHD